MKELIACKILKCLWPIIAKVQKYNWLFTKWQIYARKLWVLRLGPILGYNDSVFMSLATTSFWIIFCSFFYSRLNSKHVFNPESIQIFWWDFYYCSKHFKKLSRGVYSEPNQTLGWSFYENSEWLKAIHSKKLEPQMVSLEFLSAFSFKLCLGDWATFSHDTAVLYATFNAHVWCLELLNNALDTVDISITFQIHWFMTFNFKPLYLLISHSRKTTMVKILFNKVADL